MFYLLIMSNGEAKLMPMNSMPKYIAKPKEATVAINADTLPRSPSHGFDRTTSPIMQVMTLCGKNGDDCFFFLIFFFIFQVVFEKLSGGLD